MKTNDIALVISIISLAISVFTFIVSYLSFRSNRYRLRVFAAFLIDYPDEYIGITVINIGKRPVTIESVYVEARDLATRWRWESPSRSLTGDGPIRLDESEQIEGEVGKEPDDPINLQDVLNGASLSDLSSIKIFIVDGIGKSHRAKIVGKKSLFGRVLERLRHFFYFFLQKPFRDFRRFVQANFFQQFRRSTRRLDSQLRSLLRINKG